MRKLTRLEQEVLDAAWERWQRGEITERSPAPNFGDAYKLRYGQALETSLRRIPSAGECWRCGRKLGKVQFEVCTGPEWHPIGPECVHKVPEDSVRRKGE